MRVRCPHCHQPVELVENVGLEQIDCPSCGSHFSLLGEQTASWHGREGRTIGHFELIERLGMGQFGTVWMARDSELDRTVAVKIPRQEQLGPGDVEMFLREARTAAQLHHPNIVSVHEVGRDGDTVYIVSDLVRGVTLADRLTAGRLSPREAATLCVTIADALHHAHQAGVIHRDLKPSNTMIDADGQPHLMDFGLAKREAAEITMTLDGRILGTPAYMSPEQARGEAHQADARSDIYSLGTILFELLTGELPFRGNKRMLLIQIMHDEPPSPRKLDAAVPRDLETISLKCLEKSPERRYATAREVADELRRYLARQPIHARPVGRVERSWRWCRRNPVVASLAASVLVVLLVGAGISTYFAIEERAAKFAAEQAAKGERQQAIAAKADRDRADREAAAAVVARQTAEGEQAKAEAAEAVAKQEKTNAEQAAEREKTQRLATEILRVAAQSQAVAAEEPIQSVLLALEAMRLAKDGDAASRAAARQSLRDSVASVGGTPLRCSGLYVDRVQISPDNHWLLAVGTLTLGSNPWSEGRLWDLTAKEPASGAKILSGGVYETAFSPDGRWLATRAPSLLPTPRLWDLAANEPDARPAEVLGHDKWIVWSAASADGRWLATAISDRTIRVRDLTVDDPFAKSVVLHGHEDRIRTLAFSANGRWLVTTSLDKTARVWDLTADDPSRGAIVVRENFASAFIVAEISSDGHWLATYGGARAEIKSGRDAQLWDLTSSDPTAAPLLVGVATRGILLLGPAISPDGRWLVMGYQDHGSLTQTPNDGVVAVRSYLWDLTAQDPATHRVNLAAHSGSPAALLMSPDGRWLVSGGGDNTACVWDLATNDPAAHRVTLRGHNAPVGALAISGDGHRLATGSHDKTVRVWDLMAADPAASSMVLRGCEGPIRSMQSLAISQSGDSVAVCTQYVARGALAPRLWNLTPDDPNTEPIVLRGHARWVSTAAISPDGRLLATAGLDNTVRLWHLTGRRPPTASLVLRGHEDFIRSAAFAPDGRWLVTASGDATARLWRMSADDPAANSVVLRGHKEGILLLAISRDGRWLATASSDKTVRVWDLTADDPAAKSVLLRGHEDDILWLAISPDNHWLATGGTYKTARLWNLTADDPAATLIERRHPSNLCNLAFSPNNHWLATASFDSKVRLWNMTADGPTANPIVLDEDNDNADRIVMAFSPDGRWLATSGSRGTRLRELRAGDNPAVLLVALDATNATSLTFSSDGRWLIAPAVRSWLKNARLPPWVKRAKEPGEDFTRVWNLRAANPTADGVVLRHAAGTLIGQMISGNGRWLVTTTNGPTAQLWDLDESNPAASAVVLRGAGQPLTISPDGRTLVTASGDGAVRLWSLDPDDLVRRARVLTGRELSDEERKQFLAAVSPPADANKD